MERKLFLLRHGETVWNRENRMQGFRDVPLTRNGVDEATRMGRALAGYLDGHADYRVVASPLSRCRQTAALVCEEIGYQYDACQFCDALEEVNLGEWEGRTWDEVDARYPGELARRRADHWDHVPPGGESYATMSMRVIAWLDAEWDEQPLVVVTHGGVGRVIRGYYAKLPPNEAADLEVPQDAFYLLSDGRVARIEIAD